MLPKFITKRKIASIILFFFLISTLLTKPIQAFYTPNSTYQFQFEQAVFRSPEEMNLQSFVYEVLKAVIGSIITTISSCVTCAPGEGETGAIRTIGSFIAFLYASPPASGVQYLASIGKRLDIVNPTYAQEEGPGFEKMKAYRDIWKKFRDLSYVFFVLVLVFMGFAIMFRVKINPQTVITIQSALPKVVLALILITFSYAIVGLLIDFMYVIANLILFTFRDLIGIFDWAERFGYDLAITSDVKAFGVIFLAGLFPSLAIILFFMLLMLLPSATGGIIGILTGGFGWGAVAIIDLFILAILVIVFLIAMIRVFWSLLKAYVMVVINLIFAPFQILIGVLPGSNTIGSWFKNLIANLAVFPTTLVMLLLSFYLVSYALRHIIDQIKDFFAGGITFEELINLAKGPLGESGPEMTILCFVSLGILLMAPKVSDMIKAFLAGKPFEYGTAIGEAIGPVRMVAPYGVGYGAREAAAWGVKYERAMRRTGRPRLGAAVRTITKAAHEMAKAAKIST